MTNKVNAVIFVGAVWGFAEASLGWLLHLAHAPHIALWMSPIVLACIMLAYILTGKASSVMYVAVIAALIKCADLLLPVNVPLYYVLNPAAYILIEGLAGALIIKVLNFKRLPRLSLALTPSVSVIALVVAVAANLLACIYR